MEEYIKIRKAVGGYVVDVSQCYRRLGWDTGEVVCKTFEEVNEILFKCFVTQVPLETGETLKIVRGKRGLDNV